MMKLRRTNFSTRQKGTYAKLLKTETRIQKKMDEGSFAQMAKKKQRDLLLRLRRYALQMEQWGFALKVGFRTSALALALSVTTSVNAQTFSTPATSPAPSNTPNYSAPAIVDIDADGDLDLFLGTQNGGILYYQNDGTAESPVFNQVTPSPITETGYMLNPTFGDLDGDGDLDAIVTDFYGKAYHYENTGSPQVPVFAPATLLVSYLGGYYSGPTLIDIDTDGDLDLVTGNPATLYENTGSPTAHNFVAKTGADNPFQGIYSPFSGLSFIDLDFDGDMDFFCGNGGGGTRYFQNTGDACSPSFIEMTGSNNPFDGVSGDVSPHLEFADLDADGDMDAMVGDASSLVYFENSSPPPSVQFTEEPGPFDGFGNLDFVPTAPSFTDIDGDGDFDAFLGVYSNVEFYENTGTPKSASFTANTSFDLTINGEYIQPVAVDLDADGDKDIVVGNIGEIKYFLNMGDATSANLIEQTGGDNPFDAAAASAYFSPAFVDIDADGDFDLFAGADGAILFFENTGSSTNPNFVEITGAGNPLVNTTTGSDLRIDFADLDRDGDMDLAVGLEYGTMEYYENQGSAETPSFSGTPSFNSNTSAKIMASPLSDVSVTYHASPTFVDIDADGDLDLFAGSIYGVVFFRNGEETLDVELQSFDAVGLGNKSKLTWSTANETDNRGFEVQRATGNQIQTNQWKNLGFVDSQNNGILGSQYDFIDENPRFGVNYYRLKIVGQDGTVEYSRLATVIFNLDEPSVSPNPVKGDQFVLTLPKSYDKGLLSLFDATGRLLSQQTLSGVSARVDVASLSKGVYLLSIDLDGEKTQKRIIRQ